MDDTGQRTLNGWARKALIPILIWSGIVAYNHDVWWPVAVCSVYVLFSYLVAYVAEVWGRRRSEGRSLVLDVRRTLIRWAVRCGAKDAVRGLVRRVLANDAFVLDVDGEEVGVEAGWCDPIGSPPLRLRVGDEVCVTGPNDTRVWNEASSVPGRGNVPQQRVFAASTTGPPVCVVSDRFPDAQEWLNPDASP